MTFLKQVASGVLVAFIFILTVSASLITTFTEGRLGVPFASLEVQKTPSCAIPSNWIAVELQEGDTLTKLARSLGLTEEEIEKANCLSGTIRPGDTLYVPPLDPHDREVACGPPEGWHFYTVKASENLEILAERFDITEEDLRQANCLTPAHSISVGERLFLPLPSSPTATTVDGGSETPSPEGLPPADKTPEPTESS